MREQIQAWISESMGVKQKMYHSANIAKQIITAVEMIVRSFKSGGKLLVCGNGGSSSDSAHLAAEFMNRFTLKREYPLPAIDLSAPNSTITAIANDYGYDYIFAKQVKGLGKKGDVLFGISTSGSSPNVNRAINQAIVNQMHTILLTSEMPGCNQADILHQIRVPSTKTAIIQESHIMVIHLLCHLVDEALGGE